VGVRVKICGTTSAHDAQAAVAAGADLIGVILWAGSPRAASVEAARAVREVVPDGVELVGVVVDETAERIDELIDALGLDRVQLHGAEPAALVARYGARAIRGVRDGDVSQVPEGVAVVYDRGLGATPTDATLQTHWKAAEQVGRERQVLLAGSLDAARVADAVRIARPWGVDVARGVEAAPGIKDHELVRRFVAAAKEA